MTSPARPPAPAGRQRERRGPPAPRFAPPASSQNPYSVREAAALLGVSPDAIEANYAQLGGCRVGRRILIPRWAVDRMRRDPRDRRGDGEGDGTPPLERVLTLLQLLAPEERVRVAQVALAGSPA